MKGQGKEGDQLLRQRDEKFRRQLKGKKVKINSTGKAAQQKRTKISVNGEKQWLHIISTTSDMQITPALWRKLKN